MPTDVGHLKRIVKSKYPYVESNLELIAYTVWNALEYSYAFEGIAEQLKKERLEQVCWVELMLISLSECFRHVLSLALVKLSFETSILSSAGGTEKWSDQ
jgi:hypothetical protein